MTSSVEQARALIARSRREHFAVGAFNVDNQEALHAVARAADAKRAPVLVELSHAEAEVIGLANMRSLADNYRAEYGLESEPFAAGRNLRTRMEATQRRLLRRMQPDERSS